MRVKRQTDTLIHKAVSVPLYSVALVHVSLVYALWIITNNFKNHWDTNNNQIFQGRFSCPEQQILSFLLIIPLNRLMNLIKIFESIFLQLFRYHMFTSC